MFTSTKDRLWWMMFILCRRAEYVSGHSSIDPVDSRGESDPSECCAIHQTTRAPDLQFSSRCPSGNLWRSLPLVARCRTRRTLPSIIPRKALNRFCFSPENLHLFPCPRDLGATLKLAIMAPTKNAKESHWQYLHFLIICYSSYFVISRFLSLLFVEF